MIHCTAETLRGAGGAAFGANHNARLFGGVATAGAPKSTSSAPIPEVGPEPGDLILPRYHGLSPLTGTQLDSVLRNEGITTIVVVGVSLNVAIPNLVFDAVNRAYQVVVVRDAVAGVPETYGPQILDNTLALVSTLATTDALRRGVGGPGIGRSRRGARTPGGHGGRASCAPAWPGAPCGRVPASGQRPAVDGVELAGDPRSLVGAQVHDHPRDVLTAARPPQRDLAGDELVPRLAAWHVVHAEGVDDARAHGVDPHAARAELARHRGRQGVDARLGRRVRGRVARHPLPPIDEMLTMLPPRPWSTSSRPNALLM